MEKCPILNYHGIQSKNGEYHWSPEEKVYVTPVENFKSHLDWISASGFQTLLPQELPDWKMGRLKVSKPIMITFDDGHVSHYEYAAPLLKERKMKAVFFVSAEWIGKPEYMTAGQLRDMSARGFEIASHGCGHVPLPGLSAEALRHEILDSKKILEEICGKEVQSFSIPRGFFHRAVKMSVIESGYRFMFTSHFGANGPAFDPYYLKRIAPTAYTEMQHFKELTACRFGSKEYRETIKEYGRQLLGPGFYGFLAKVKASLLAGR